MVNDKIFGILERALGAVSSGSFNSETPNGQNISHSPFFSCIQVKEVESACLEIRNGALTTRAKTTHPAYFGRMSIRMGDYEKGGGFAYNTFQLPASLEPDSSLFEIWECAEDAFWECAVNYQARNIDALGSHNAREKYAYFSRETPVAHIGDENGKGVALGEQEETLKRVSRQLSLPELCGVDLCFSLISENRYFLNSEGAKIFDNSVWYAMGITVSATDTRNLILPHSVSWQSIDLSKIPTYEELMEAGERITKELFEMIKAPIEKNGAYPAIIDGENHGVLWHEAIGHGLEGHRMQEDDFGDATSLFDGKIGEVVAPEFLSVYDDPTLEDKVGHYRYDEEGIASKRVTLLEEGVLKGYLHSRTSAGYFGTQSNGHARAENNKDPQPRMSNIVVSSSNETSFEELKEGLIKLCEQQRKTYGLLLIGTTGGMVLPEEGFFTTYPARAFRVYKNGRQEQVRGVYIVGTPYQALSNIIQTGDSYKTYNGFCGSQSGFVPSTETAPDALLTALEINRIPKSGYTELRKYVFPKPVILRE